MKITIKTLQQKLFQIEADGSDTVLDLKAKISESQGAPVESQKLIYSGKVLPDNKTVASCEIKEKDFLVLMVSKPKASASTPPVAASSTPEKPPVATAVTPSSQPEPGSVPSTLAPIPAPVPAPAATPADNAPPAVQPAIPALGASFLSGEALQSTITNMEEMGYPRDQILRALKASYNNPDRAVEYLLNGIPAHLLSDSPGAAGSEAPPVASTPNPRSTLTDAPSSTPPSVTQPEQHQTSQAPAPAAPSAPQNLFQLAQQQAAGPGGGGGGGTGGNPLAGIRGSGASGGLEGLRGDARFNAIRELVAQNPALLQPVIQQLAQNNPQLAQVLSANPEALFGLLNEGLDDAEDRNGEGGIPPGAQVVSVTPEERAAIERLEALGFPRQAVIEAYFACDKNEELAANFLFDGAFEDNP